MSQNKFQVYYGQALSTQTLAAQELLCFPLNIIKTNHRRRSPRLRLMDFKSKSSWSSSSGPRRTERRSRRRMRIRRPGAVVLLLHNASRDQGRPHHHIANNAMQ